MEAVIKAPFDLSAQSCRADWFISDKPTGNELDSMTERFGCRYNIDGSETGRCFSNISYNNLASWHTKEAKNPWDKEFKFSERIRKDEGNW